MRECSRYLYCMYRSSRPGNACLVDRYMNSVTRPAIQKVCSYMLVGIYMHACNRSTYYNATLPNLNLQDL